jgi:quinol monooxygenase YgiN
MFARTSLWTGTPETLEAWAEHASVKVKALLEGLGPQAGNVGYAFLVDRAQGRGLTLTLWESEQAALASDQTAEQSRASIQQATGIQLKERGRWQVLAASLQSGSQP